MSHKEMWIEAWEVIFEKLTGAGCPDAMAREIADERASDLVRDKLADQIDYLRKKGKENGI